MYSILCIVHVIFGGHTLGVQEYVNKERKKEEGGKRKIERERRKGFQDGVKQRRTGEKDGRKERRKKGRGGMGLGEK
jgi:hypothetical protein